MFIHILPYKNPPVTIVARQGIGTIPPFDIHIIHIIHTVPKRSIHKGSEGVAGLLFSAGVLQYTYLTDAGASHAG